MSFLHRYQELDPSLTNLFQKGGVSKRAFDKANLIIGTIINQGIGHFANLNFTNNGENRIKNCSKVDLGNGFRLIAQRCGDQLFLLYAGSHDDCDKWLNRNKGLTAVHDPEQNTVEKVYKSSDNESIASSPIPSTSPLIEKLSKNLQEILLKSLDLQAVLQIGRLTGVVNSLAIESIIGLIHDDEKRKLVEDVLFSLSNDDVENAEKLIALDEGLLTEIERLGPEDLVSIKDGGSIRRVPIGSDEYESWMNSLARSGNQINWLFFLHPEQEKMIEMDFQGSAQLSGVSGSGKTCIAVLRALRLASISSDKKVLILTLNKSLAGLINQLVDAAALTKSSRENIEVLSLFELCQKLLFQFEPSRSVIYDSVTFKLQEHVDEIFREYYRCWSNSDDAAILLPIHKSMNALGVNGENYIREEFDWIRSALSERDRHEYYSTETMPRIGRRHPIQQSWRELIVSALVGWERKMEAVGVIDYLGLTTAISRHMAGLNELYNHIIIDEAQDFGTKELELVRKLVKPGKNDMFLCGDIAQNVLPKHRNLAQANITIGQNRHKITKNYRNTRQILQAAYSVLYQNLNEEMLDRSVDDLEILDPKYANRSSNKPVVLQAENLREELSFSLTYCNSYTKINSGASCCIAIAGYTLCEIEKFAKTLNLKCLDGLLDPFAESIVLSDLEQTKGYEFDLVLITNCCEEIMPPADAPKEEIYRDACRLYVAMTRAKNDLHISYCGNPSAWIAKSENEFNFYNWSEIEQLEVYEGLQSPQKIKEHEDLDQEIELLGLNGLQFCYSSKAVGLSTEAQSKLIELVDGRGAVVSGGSRTRWKTVSDALLDLENDPRVRNLFGPVVSSEIRMHLARQ